MSNIQFQGIVAVGSSLEQAVGRYRLLAMGKGVECFVDRGNNAAFISNASSDTDSMFNPANGNMDLEQSQEILKGLEFEAKAGDVHEAYHYECISGCGSHVMFDSESFVNNCPVCATSLSASSEEEEETEDDELTDEELDNLEVSDEDEEIDPDSDEESEEEDEELEDEELEDEDADSNEEEEESDEELEDEDLEDDSEEEESDEDLEDEESDEEEEEEDTVDEDAPLVVAAATCDEAIAQYSRLRGKSMKATASSVKTVNYMVCSSDEGCGAHIIADTSISKCPKTGCGSKLVDPEATASDEEQQQAPAPTEKLEQVKSEEQKIQEEPKQPEPKAEEATASDESDEDAEGDNIGDITPEEDEDKEATASADEPTEAENVETAAPEATAAEELEEVTVNALDAVPDDASAQDFDLSYSSSVAGNPVWTAYYKGAPVALASKDSIHKDHVDMFTTQRFGVATAAAAKVGAPKRVLQELGYKGITHSLNINKHVSERAAALAADAEQQMAQEQSEYNERLSAALATAMIGINRGFFKDESNPVREALCSALTSVGVRSPEIVVDKAMRGGFEAFLRQATARAADIMSKPTEVQESLARTVLETSYMPQQATASSKVNFEERLGGLGTATASAEVAPAAKTEKTETAVATAGSDDFSAQLQAVTAGLGKRR
jgi:hypothetical protein